MLAAVETKGLGFSLCNKGEEGNILVQVELETTDADKAVATASKSLDGTLGTQMYDSGIGPWHSFLT